MVTHYIFFSSLFWVGLLFFPSILKKKKKKKVLGTEGLFFTECEVQIFILIIITTHVVWKPYIIYNNQRLCQNHYLLWTWKMTLAHLVMFQSVWYLLCLFFSLYNLINFLSPQLFLLWHAGVRRKIRECLLFLFPSQDMIP